MFYYTIAIVTFLVAFMLSFLFISWKMFQQNKDIIEMQKKLNLETKTTKNHIMEYSLGLLLMLVVCGLIAFASHFLAVELWPKKAEISMEQKWADGQCKISCGKSQQ